MIELIQQMTVFFPHNDWLWLTGCVTLDGIRNTSIDADCSAEFLGEDGL